MQTNNYYRGDCVMYSDCGVVYTYTSCSQVQVRVARVWALLPLRCSVLWYCGTGLVYYTEHNCLYAYSVRMCTVCVCMSLNRRADCFWWRQNHWCVNSCPSVFISWHTAADVCGIAALCFYATVDVHTWNSKGEGAELWTFTVCVCFLITIIYKLIWRAN